MAEKRKRSSNFTADEKEKLVKLLFDHKETILNKKTDGSTNEAKYKAWIDLTNKFNASSSTYRSKDSLMKLWEKLKSESKYLSSMQRNKTQTSGGPSVVKINPILEQVCSMMGHGCTSGIGGQDSDTDPLESALIEQNSPKVVCSANSETEIKIEDFIYMAPLAETKYDTPEEKETVDSVTSESPRRCSVQSQMNDHTEAVHSNYSSYTQVNQKEEIEHLKRRLLKDEIAFKNKLHYLQLQAAEKDLEIKEEIIKQLRGEKGRCQELYELWVHPPIAM